MSRSPERPNMRHLLGPLRGEQRVPAKPASVRGARPVRWSFRRMQRAGQSEPRLPFSPPEDWHEPRAELESAREDQAELEAESPAEPAQRGEPAPESPIAAASSRAAEPAREPRPAGPTPRGAGTPGYRVVSRPAGAGYRHVVTPAEIRERLAQLPTWMVDKLEVVQLSRMTRKKRSFPCYGMQWGSTIYLYPMEQSLVEVYDRPPLPAQRQEADMHGARWEQAGPSTWRLIWTPETIREFYLNNILIHELGHILDDRNTSTTDRERFAEWFALRYGRPPRERIEQARARRHHRKSIDTWRRGA